MGLAWGMSNCTRRGRRRLTAQTLSMVYTLIITLHTLAHKNTSIYTCRNSLWNRPQTSFNCTDHNFHSVRVNLTVHKCLCSRPAAEQCWWIMERILLNWTLEESECMFFVWGVGLELFVMSYLPGSEAFNTIGCVWLIKPLPFRLTS